MSKLSPLSGDRLRTRCDAKALDFRTTESLEALTETIGQGRALGAVRFGIGIRRDGYNLYVMGPTGIGKKTMVGALLAQTAKDEPTPCDWCYVHNFEHPHKPCAIQLPAGGAAEFRHDMDHLVEELSAQVPAAFESEEYQSRVQEIDEEFKERQEQAVQELTREAEEQGVKLMRTPGGFAFAPVYDGEVISPEDFSKLHEDDQERIKAKVVQLQERMQDFMRQMLQWSKESRDRLKDLNRQVALAAVGDVIAELKRKYESVPELAEYLDAVEAAVVENVDDFRKPREGELRLPGLAVAQGGPALERYQVNVLVDHRAGEGAPVVYEDHPTYPNLVGRVDQRAQLGALTTDFTLIKPGALHLANGGYLVLDARKVLMQPFAWEALKVALNTREIRIESLSQMLAIGTVSLEPEQVPLDLKVLLLGDRYLYYLLYQLDPEFGELFKVSADFDERVDRVPESDALYARLVATVVRNNELRHLDREAVALVIEESARMAADAEKLSAHMGGLADLLREADYWAGEAGRDVVTGEDVDTAVSMRIRRVDRVRNLVQEQIRRGTVLIDTDGEKVGQINGLSVLLMGDFSFGQPSRITATARIGNGEVVDIEREVKLGGPTHSKGVLIISNFLAERYATNRPLSLTASLVFEQSYGHVDGDSASVAETCALLSVLAGAPIKQSLAVTGSVNQRGQVQAIGGVNEKVEGFFDVCKARGLGGQHGVVIPASNVKHLMLRREVVEAAEAGQFHVYAVETVDEAVELLMGVEAGVADDGGSYPPASVNGRVVARLDELSEIHRKLAAEAKGEEAGA